MSSSGDSDSGDEARDIEFQAQFNDQHSHEGSQHDESCIQNTTRSSSQSGDNFEQGSVRDENEQEYDDRENRFQGSENTWRFYTQDERSLASSIDQQRANDLSVHLYNAHALKARLRDADMAKNARPWLSKQSWIKPVEDGKLPWHPERSWVAWPLPPEDVPRQEEVFGAPVLQPDADEANYRKEEPWVPSADLEAEIFALMLRKVTERFRRRQWAQNEVAIRPEPSGESTLISSAFKQPDSLVTHGKQSANISDGESLSDIAILDDDDVAHAILRPTVRHILAEFDELLTGLHKSRQGHGREQNASRSQSRTSQPRSRSRSDSAPRVRGKANLSKGRHLQLPSDDDVDSPSNSEDIDVSKDGDGKRAKQKRRDPISLPHPLGLRDWSEVLGIASFVGWDPNVVDRAARRCASLFDEKMRFTGMPEATNDEGHEGVIEYVPNMVQPQEWDPDIEDESLTDESHNYYFCPYASCARHSEPFEKAWRWREHLHRKHKLTVEQVRETETKLEFTSFPFPPNALEAEESPTDERDRKPQ